MRDFSLHILDLMENSLRAGASIISVKVDEKPDSDELEIAVEDNGPGLSVPAERAMDPYYTTKHGKRTGLGLSLFRAAVEQARGRVELRESPLGGTAVYARMQLNHIDRKPLGDLAAIFSSMVCTNPYVDFWFEINTRERRLSLRVSEMMRESPGEEPRGLTLARRISKEIREGLMLLTA